MQILMKEVILGNRIIDEFLIEISLKLSLK
jgi:hypothetical protein